MIIEIFETDYSSSCFLLNEIQIVILTLRCPKDENRRQTEYPFSCFQLNAKRDHVTIDIKRFQCVHGCPKSKIRVIMRNLLRYSSANCQHQNRITNKCQRLTVNFLSLKQEILRIASKAYGSLFKLGWCATPYFSA